MLLLEPAFLRGFGTTPGKAILGFRLEHEDGRKLTYLEGLSRTWQVALWGMGLGIPIYSLYRYFKSYGTHCGQLKPESLDLSGLPGSLFI